LAAMLESAGHTLVPDAPDVVLCDLAREARPPAVSDAPVIVLTDHALPGEQPAGVLPHMVDTDQLEAALRAVTVGLLVRVPGSVAVDGFRPLGEDAPLLTPREAEILTLVGQGMSNKAVSR